ncbi:hypothetical protein N8878_08550 [Psychromonas sp.]|nr:hypothetical protein [Psychromonas sp.]
MDNKKAFKKLQKQLKKLKKSNRKDSGFSANAPIADVLHWVKDNSVNQTKSSKIHQYQNDFDVFDLSSVYQAYKSPACKKCPALNNGMCKCALKRINKVA